MKSIFQNNCRKQLTGIIAFNHCKIHPRFKQIPRVLELKTMKNKINKQNTPETIWMFSTSYAVTLKNGYEKLANVYSAMSLMCEQHIDVVVNFKPGGASEFFGFCSLDPTYRHTPPHPSELLDQAFVEAPSLFLGAIHPKNSKHA